MRRTMQIIWKQAKIALARPIVHSDWRDHKWRTDRYDSRRLRCMANIMHAISKSIYITSKPASAPSPERLHDRLQVNKQINHHIVGDRKSHKDAKVWPDLVWAQLNCGQVLQSLSANAVRQKHKVKYSHHPHSYMHNIHRVPGHPD